MGSGWASLGTHASTLGKSRGGHPRSVRWQLRARGFASVVRSAEDLQGAPCTNLFTCCDEGWVAGHRAHAHRMRLLGDVQCPRPEAFLHLVLLTLEHIRDAFLPRRPRAPLRVEVLCKFCAVALGLLVPLPLQETPVVLERLRRVILVPGARASLNPSVTRPSGLPDDTLEPPTRASHMSLRALHSTQHGNTAEGNASL